MASDPLLTTLLDLDSELQSQQSLIIGGGYGLYLKQLYLQKNPAIRTLIDIDELPSARTTNDIDLILRAEIVTHSESMKSIRKALDKLGFNVVPEAQYMQFTREMSPGSVRIDLLAAPLGEFASRVKKDYRRVKPMPSVKLHASKLEEALAVDRFEFRVPIEGQLSSGETHRTEVLIPQVFSYLLMKLFAFRDRMNDVDKDNGRHHALDIYRIVGLLTEEEDLHVRELVHEFNGHPTLIEARSVVSAYFEAPNGIGCLRIREHPLAKANADIDRFRRELQQILRTR